MIAIAFLVAAFLLVGGAVVAAAFAGGRRRTSSAGPSRGASRLLYTGVAIVCVGIGLGLPLLLLINNAADADRTAVGGVDLTATQAKGRELFASNCATCHTLQASNSVGVTGPNLDVLRPAAGLVENAILVGRARGAGNMPVGLVTGDDAKAVADYVAAVAGRGHVQITAPGSATTTAPATPTTPAAPAAPAATTPTTPATPAAPSSGGSSQASAAGKTVFTANCASCHTLKSAGASGQVGPNLDTLKPDAATVTKQVLNGGGGMPPFKGQLTDKQIADVALFVAATAGS
jgi:mono/diheme cytochrome c family protein